MPASTHKIASGDLTHHGLIDACARTGRPLVMSTGMAMPSEIVHATWRAAQAERAARRFCYCVSVYPVPRQPESAPSPTLADAFDLPVGLSDHAASTSAVPIAVTLGASRYERHLVLDDDDDAVDRAVSSTPGEFAAIVRVAAETATARSGTAEKSVCRPRSRTACPAGAAPARRVRSVPATS